MITIADVKQYLNLTGSAKDTFLGSVVKSVLSTFDCYTGRTLAARDYSPDPESEFYAPGDTIFDGIGSRVIFLPHYPVNSVSLLTINGTEMPAAESALSEGYVADKAGNIVLSYGYRFSRGFRNISVAYNAGYDPIPDGLKLAATEYAAWIYKRSGHGNDLLGVNSKAMPDGSISYTSQDMPGSVETVLKRYRRLIAR